MELVVGGNVSLPVLRVGEDTILQTDSEVSSLSAGRRLTLGLAGSRGGRVDDGNLEITRVAGGTSCRSRSSRSASNGSGGNRG